MVSALVEVELVVVEWVVVVVVVEWVVVEWEEVMVEDKNVSSSSSQPTRLGLSLVSGIGMHSPNAQQIRCSSLNIGMLMVCAYIITK